MLAGGEWEEEEERGGGSGQGREQHGISTFLTFSHTVMLQSADWRSSFCLHGNLATKQVALDLRHIYHQLGPRGPFCAFLYVHGPPCKVSEP